MKINGEAVRVIRERSGYSQSQLSVDSGVELTALNRIESGKRKATEAQTVALAHALKVPLLTIICECGDTRPVRTDAT